MPYFIVNKTDFEAWQPTGDPHNGLTFDALPDGVHGCIYIAEGENPMVEVVETEFGATGMTLEELHQFQVENPEIFQEA